MTNLGILSRSPYGLYLGPMKDCDLVESLTWAQGWNVREPNTDSKIRLKSKLGSIVILVQDLVLNQRTKIHIFFHQWNIAIKNRWFNFKLYGHRNQCWLRSKSGKDTRVNINSKTETESQSCESGSHSQSSLISLKWKLANSSKVWDLSSSSWCEEIKSWLKFSRHHDSWFLSIWLGKSGMVKIE